GLPLAPALAQRLLRRAQQGAWTERRDEQPPGSQGLPLFSSDAVAAAYAPLHSRGRLLGLLALSTELSPAEALTDAVAQALSAAIDFAAVAAALLGPTLQQRMEERSTRAGLRDLLDERAFTPVFQPIVRLDDECIVGFETLTRFADGTEPRERFAQAAALGMGQELEAATMAASLSAANGRLDDTWLSVNVSPGFLASGGPEALARSASVDLVLELTEHDPVEDYADLSRAVERIPAVRLSIDDAGAGYACLTHVLALRPAFVKLDRGWVTGIDRDPARQALVAGLESFATRTGSALIAEGVETSAELQTLRSLGVELGQGYLLGRPVQVDALDAPGLALVEGAAPRHR
ncbi:MAG: EAL domain-containing protein, partial [Egibacteraceae bacterium]